MSRPRARAPVVLIGMHRSGTSLLARTLEELGLFVGWKLAPNHEASFFNKLNSWLLSSSGGRWDTPASIDHLLADAPGRGLAVAYLRDQMASPRVMEFLGPARYLRYHSLFRVEQAWGWKDPRSTLTLDFWLEIFPEARVIHVVRHGVDVADSLHRRQQTGFELGRRNFERYRWALRLFPKKGWFGTSPRLTRRPEAFRLWEEYLAHAARGTAGLGNRLLELRFETLLETPREEIARVAAFCGLEPEPGALEAAASRVRGDRALAFRRDPGLLELFREVRRSPWMERYGYDSLGPDPRARDDGPADSIPPSTKPH